MINLLWPIKIEDTVVVIFLNSSSVLITNAELTICSRTSDNQPDPIATVNATGTKINGNTETGFQHFPSVYNLRDTVFKIYFVILSPRKEGKWLPNSLNK